MRVGDRVKLILDKEVSPDNRWHGKTGTITAMSADAAEDVTGDRMDNLLFEVDIDGLSDEEQPDLHFRYDDLVLVEEHEQALGTRSAE